MSSEYLHKSLMFSATVLILTPMLLTILAPSVVVGVQSDELLDGYERMTGLSGDTRISVWPLQGIYTPFTGSVYDEDADQTITYGYTEDGWLYGQQISSYSPIQFQNGIQDYTVYKAPDGVYRYWIDTLDYNADKGTGHRGTGYRATQADVDEGRASTVGDYVAREQLGEIYNEVSFDRTNQSDIFFVESSRQEDANGHFKYEYTGYRYSFVPISNYTAVDQDGNSRPIIANMTSLSMIWYVYAAQSGISGQLTISGSDGGVAYINAAQILSVFKSNTSTASFDMVFNGVKMTIINKIDPIALNQPGATVESCYNSGMWSVMVTSLATESSAYLNTSYSKDPMQILDTVWELLTFDLSDYELTPWVKTLCSIVFYFPFYIMLVVICLDKGLKAWVAVGALAAFETIAGVIPF